MEQIILIVYIVCLTVLFFFGAHGFVMVFHYYKHRHEQDSDLPLTQFPMVTIQLPVFNEMYVVRVSSNFHVQSIILRTNWRYKFSMIRLMKRSILSTVS